MTGYDEKLSAFLDGELPEAETREVEAALARDPGLQADLETLMAADDLAKDLFAVQAHEPVPMALATAIRDAPVAMPANQPARSAAGLPGWLSVAAALVFLLIGGTGGYLAGRSQDNVQAEAPGWLSDIAGYHGVYAAESRHLVEVPASEADHITAWLTGSVGTPVNIPDLSGNGLTFQGARLLVAAGKPVAQLMYTDEGGAVLALCLIRSASPGGGFTTHRINGFDMVSWGSDAAKAVIIGPEGRSDLVEIAENAATQV